MNPSDLSDIFSSMRAKKGDNVAKNTMKEERIQQFDLQLESLSMSLQMQFNRLQSSTLHKIKSKEIGDEIKNIVEAGMENLINIYLCDEDFYKIEMHNLFERIKADMDEKTRNTAKNVQGLNIYHDFEKISYQLGEFDYANVIRVIKCMLIININRRAKRRHYLKAC